MTLVAFSHPQSYQIAVLKYSGGGDWYANPTSLPNLMKFSNQQLKTTINKVDDVDVLKLNSKQNVIPGEWN